MSRRPPDGRGSKWPSKHLWTPQELFFQWCILRETLVAYIGCATHELTYWSDLAPTFWGLTVRTRTVTFISHSPAKANLSLSLTTYSGLYFSCSFCMDECWVVYSILIITIVSVNSVISSHAWLSLNMPRPLVRRGPRLDSPSSVHEETSNPRSARNKLPKSFIILKGERTTRRGTGTRLILGPARSEVMH